MADKTETKPNYWKGMSFGQKVSHFFTYYKYHVLTVLVLASMLLLYVEGRVNYVVPDIAVFYVGTEYPYEEELILPIQNGLTGMTVDHNEDGETNVVVTSNYYTADMDLETRKAVRDKNTAELFAGDSRIYILSREAYDDFRTLGAFREITDLAGDRTFDGYGVKVKDTVFASMLTYDFLPEDYVVCMRVEMYYEDEADIEQEAAYYANHIEVFKQILRTPTDAGVLAVNVSEKTVNVLAEAVEQVSADLDGDGKVTVTRFNISRAVDEAAELTLLKIDAKIVTDRSRIYLVSRDMAEFLAEKKRLTDLSTLLDVPEGTYCLGAGAVSVELPDGMVLCLGVPREFPGVNRQTEEAKYFANVSQCFVELAAETLQK